MKGPVRILLRGGVYHLTETLELGPEDSGTEGAVISYEAFPGETPVISGGRAIRNWQKHDATVWVAEAPWVIESEERFTQLFVDGQRRVRARTPDHGKYFYTKRLRLTTGGTPICLGFTFFEEITNHGTD